MTLWRAALLPTTPQSTGARHGRPGWQASNGALTVATLAAEADLPRQRIYEHHADLLTEFRTKAHTGAPVTASIQALQQQLADAHARIHTLEATQTQLNAKIIALCAVIAELTVEAHTDNLVALHSKRRSRRELESVVDGLSSRGNHRA